MKNAIINLVTFIIGLLIVHFMVGLTAGAVIGIALGIFIYDLTEAVKGKKND